MQAFRRLKALFKSGRRGFGGRELTGRPSLDDPDAPIYPQPEPVDLSQMTIAVAQRADVVAMAALLESIAASDPMRIALFSGVIGEEPLNYRHEMNTYSLDNTIRRRLPNRDQYVIVAKDGKSGRVLGLAEFIENGVKQDEEDKKKHEEGKVHSLPYFELVDKRRAQLSEHMRKIYKKPELGPYLCETSAHPSHPAGTQIVQVSRVDTLLMQLALNCALIRGTSAAE
jgi:hypothetical protein